VAPAGAPAAALFAFMLIKFMSAKAAYHLLVSPSWLLKLQVVQK
jgi:hypothetical protein